MTGTSRRCGSLVRHTCIGRVYLAEAGLLLTGADISRHLTGCGRVILLAATLSAAADRLIRQAQVYGMADALVVDALCVAAIEQACDAAEAEIFAAAHAPYRTWRFSPGYGDLPITLQSGILHALNAQRRIGLTVTPSSLLIPSKSVTAIIGISDSPTTQIGKQGCASCNMRGRCAFSKSGTSCGTPRL